RHILFIRISLSLSVILISVYRKDHCPPEDPLSEESLSEAAERAVRFVCASSAYSESPYSSTTLWKYVTAFSLSPFPIYACARLKSACPSLYPAFIRTTL